MSTVRVHEHCKIKDENKGVTAHTNSTNIFYISTKPYIYLHSATYFTYKNILRVLSYKSRTKSTNKLSKTT